MSNDRDWFGYLKGRGITSLVGNLLRKLIVFYQTSFTRYSIRSFNAGVELVKPVLHHLITHRPSCP